MNRTNNDCWVACVPVQRTLWEVPFSDDVCKPIRFLLSNSSDSERDARIESHVEHSRHASRQGADAYPAVVITWVDCRDVVQNVVFVYVIEMRCFVCGRV